MLVQDILGAKSDNKVVTVPPNASVADAAEILSEKGIGTVIVSANGSTADGILSERDIVRSIGRDGAGCLNRPVSELMTSDLKTAARQDRVVTVLTTMTEGHFRHMPVLEDGQLVGIITLGDAIKARLSELSMQKDALEGMVMGY